VAILSFEKDARRCARVIDRQYDDGTRVMDEVASSLYAAWFLDVVGGDPEDWTAIYGFRGDDMSLAGRFRHAKQYNGFRLSASDFSSRRPEAGSAMLPGMGARPRVAIVGAGKLGTALALALRAAGYSIDLIIARGRGASLKRAQRLAEQVRGRAATELSSTRAQLIWFCVPDSQISRAAQSLAAGVQWKGRVALHSSGALGSEELGFLRSRGASIASVHPLMTFVQGSRPSLAGVPFPIEGDEAALRLARRVIRDLGGRAYPIRRADKAAYHAWGTFASPLLTALLAATEQVATLTGVSRTAARQRMIPILQQTLANYAALGPEKGFSGPIIRGDVDTVERHLQVLRTDKVLRDAYVALARAALRYLPVKQKNLLQRLLARSGD
jgi:predicted short-subunit dehydrogenase-like oxidoreductase (DUF2520 family)